MKTIEILNPENATEDEIVKYQFRECARAIVYDQDGNIGILHVSNENYHKLPGGGVEKGENILEALKRECQEELGCNIEVHGEVGQIVEYRKIFQLKQISYVYLASVVGEKGTPAYTSEEIDGGFSVQWLNIDEALELLTNDRARSDEGKLYIVPRDTALLQAAKDIKM